MVILNLVNEKIRHFLLLNNIINLNIKYEKILRVKLITKYHSSFHKDLVLKMQKNNKL